MCLFFSLSRLLVEFSSLHIHELLLLLTFLIIKQERKEKKRAQERACYAHDTRVSSPAFGAYTSIYNHFLLLLFPPFRRIFFLFDTHTVSWLLCVCVSTSFFSLLLSFLERARAHIHIHTHTHKQVVICIFCPLFSLALSSLLVGFVLRFSSLSLSLFFSRVCACVVPCARSSSSSSSSSSLSSSSSSPFSTMPTSWAPPDRSTVDNYMLCAAERIEWQQWQQQQQN